MRTAKTDLYSGYKWISTPEEGKRDPTGDAPKRPVSNTRRSLLKTTGAVGLIGVPTFTGAVQANDQVSSNEQGFTIDVAYSQDDLVIPGAEITSGCVVDHGNTGVSNGKYEHSYDLFHGHGQTDSNGDPLSELAAQTFIWDGTMSDANVDFLIDMDSPYVGVYPSPNTEGPVEDTVETLIQTAIGAISTKATVAVTAATVIADILNWIDDTTDPDDKKQWDWAHFGVGNGKESFVGNQMYTVVSHSADKSPKWQSRSVADSLGVAVDYYAGDPPDDISYPADPSTATTTEDGTEVFVARTSGLEREDFHALPHPADMTRKERQKFGVRRPTDSEVQAAKREGRNPPEYTVDRYPMTAVVKDTTDRQ